MAFTWVIEQLNTIPSIDGMDKVISVIHARAQKQEEDFIADTKALLHLDLPHESSLIPYAEVTQAMVEGWLTEGLDTEAIEANLDAQIENFLNPPIVAYPLPWDSE